MKTYIKPKTTVISIAVSATILAASDIYNALGTKNALSKDSNNDDWDEEE